MRTAWVASRKGKSNVSQLYFARQGVVTEEMAYVAKREGLPESLIKKELLGYFQKRSPRLHFPSPT